MLSPAFTYMYLLRLAPSYSVDIASSKSQLVPLHNGNTYDEATCSAILSNSKIHELPIERLGRRSLSRCYRTEDEHVILDDLDQIA